MTKIKIHQKYYMRKINYACFKLEENAITSVKRNKNNFINIRDKLTISIR